MKSDGCRQPLKRRSRKSNLNINRNRNAPDLTTCFGREASRCQEIRIDMPEGWASPDCAGMDEDISNAEQDESESNGEDDED